MLCLKAHSRAIVYTFLCVLANQVSATQQLFMAPVGGESLLLVDETSAQFVVHQSLPSRLFYDIAGDPLDSSSIYTVSMNTGTDFEPAWISRIDTVGKTFSDVVMLDPTWFGYPSTDRVNVDALAISPAAPHVAVIAATSIDFGPAPRLLRFDLQTLTPLAPAVDSDHMWGAFTYTPDGQTLLGATNFFDGPTYGSGSDLYQIDPLTGNDTLIGYTGSTAITGMAFSPEDHALYAVDAYKTDALVILDPDTGAITATIGPFGIAGPEGIAFLPVAVPEPSALVLCAIGVQVLVRRRR